MIIETERLYLRELEQTDIESLSKILQDEQTMYAYEGAFDDIEVQNWLTKQMKNYKRDGFGCAPCMGENLVVKVHYRLGSRNC